MNEKYTYSFIIPHHNTPDLLYRCLDSIPQREDIQIIVVDDNSKADKKPQITRTDVEVVYIDAAHTKGAGHARNEGLARARGKWLLFADCDDYYSDGFIGVLDAYKDMDIEVLYFNYTYIDSVTKLILRESNLQKHIMHYKGNKEQTDYIKFRNNTPWSKMVLRDYVNLHNIYFEEVPNGNDVLFSLFVATYTDKISVCDKRLYFYIKNPDSIATSKQDFSKFISRVTHVVKHNAFNKSIGHSNWNKNPFKYVLGYLRSGNVSNKSELLLRTIASIPALYATRNEWVSIINKNK